MAGKRISFLVTLFVLALYVASVSAIVLETEQLILYTGDPQTWKDMLPDDNSEIVEDLEQGAIQLLYRPNIKLDASVLSINPYPKDPEYKSIGNGEGGLLVSMRIREEFDAGALRPYDVEEINSILTNLAPESLVSLLVPAATVEVVATDAKFALQCTGACIAMIVICSVIGGLMLVVFVFYILYSCCRDCLGCCPSVKDYLDE